MKKTKGTALPLKKGKQCSVQAAKLRGGTTERERKVRKSASQEGWKGPSTEKAPPSHSRKDRGPKKIKNNKVAQKTTKVVERTGP